METSAQAFPNRPAGACVRCRRIKTKCTFPDAQAATCRSCQRGGYECVFLSKAERTAEKRRRAQRFASSRENGSRRSQSHSLSRTQSRSGTQSPHKDPSRQHRSTSPDVSAPPTTAPYGEQVDDDEDLSAELLDQCEELLRKFLWPFSPLHWPTFQKQLANGKVERSLYYALLASSVRASRKLSPYLGSPVAASDFFASKARRYVLENLDTPSLADVQALLLITLLDWGSSRGTRAFMYSGLATRMALSFLPEADHRLADDFVAAETARRTIWMVFMMEQFLSCGNGRVPTIRARELPISLPCSEMDFTFGIPSIVPMFDGGVPPCPPSSHGSVGKVGEFGSMIQISGIWHLVATWKFKCRPEDPVEPQLQKLEDTLFEWRDSVPTQYQDRPGHLDLHISLGTGFAFGFIHCVYHCALVFIHRERLYDYNSSNQKSPPSSVDTRARDHSIETIFSSSERIVEIMNTLEATGTEDMAVIFPIFMLYSCFTASSAVAYISVKQWTISRQASYKIVRESLRILRSMESSWPLVAEWHAQLSALVRVLQDRAMGIGGSASSEDLPFERLRYSYGHVRAQTPATPIGAPTSTTRWSGSAGHAPDDAGQEPAAPDYFAELSPSFRPDITQLLDNQDDLSIFLG